MAQLLQGCRQGDEAAFRRLVSLLYRDLLRIARCQLRHHRRSQTLNTAALVHESYLRLSRQTKASWQNEALFFTIAARVMRHVIVDYARKQRAQKRGGDAAYDELEGNEPRVRQQSEQVISLHEALGRLATVDPRLVSLVECRFFAGYTEQETAAVLGVSLRTVQRDWKRARGWLKVELEDQLLAV